MADYRVLFSTITCLWLTFNHSGNTEAFKVLQPASKMVNPDRTVSIACEHTESNVSSIRGAQLKKSASTFCICNSTCDNAICYKDGPRRFIFILLNVDDEKMANTYECEIAKVTMKNGFPLFTHVTGQSTKLLPAPEESKEPKPGLCPTPLSAQPLESPELQWALIGLLAIGCLYGVTITIICCRMRVIQADKLHDSFIYMPMQRKGRPPVRPVDSENSAYMDMRRVPLGDRRPLGPNHTFA